MAEPHVQDVPSSDQNEKNNKLKIEKSVLDTFRKLSNGNENVRIKAGIEILRHLTQMKDRENVRLSIGYHVLFLSFFVF